MFPLRREDVKFPKMISKEGTFGAVRKHDIHTGVDLYTVENATVYAMEDGVVATVEQFTGPPESPWWLVTYVVMVEGPSGVIAYGEVSPQVQEGDRVVEGQEIARVIPVLPEGKERYDIPGHSRYMLHLELYVPDTRRPVWWLKGAEQPCELLDPMPLLSKAWNERAVSHLAEKETT